MDHRTDNHGQQRQLVRTVTAVSPADKTRPCTRRMIIRWISDVPSKIVKLPGLVLHDQ